MKTFGLILLLGLMFAGSNCPAQMYSVTALGTLGGSTSYAFGVNNHGQVVGYSNTLDGWPHAFRTAPNSPINPATDDLGTLGGPGSFGLAINDFGQVVGYSWMLTGASRAFRTAPNSAINPLADDLGSIAKGSCFDFCSIAEAINNSGQVAGRGADFYAWHAFRTASNSPIDPAYDDLGTLLSGEPSLMAFGINASGQVVGGGLLVGGGNHAFRTAPNSPINPAYDDLGTLSGTNWSFAEAINDFGQVVGYSGNHAFRTAPNSAIDPLADDLGYLGAGFPGVPDYSEALAINAFGEVVGESTSHFVQVDPSDGRPYYVTDAFIYSTHAIYDLNDLVSPDSAWELVEATGINNTGQIVGIGKHDGEIGWSAFRLDPIYRGSVQQPINADGSSVFRANRGVLPVRFAVTQFGTNPSCTLPATISLTRVAAGTNAAVAESAYSMQADNGSSFRIDSTACQYVYNLAASGLGVGIYRVDISINGIMIGHANFGLE